MSVAVIGATIVITIVNGKGGSGKTPTAVHLSYALARMGYHVLFCDLDQQGSASFHFLGFKYKNLQPTIYNALRDLTPIAPVEILPTLHLLPAHDELAGLEIQLPKMKAKGKYIYWQGRLADLLNLYPGYDFLICDTPGSAISIFPTMALASSDLAIVPTKTEITAVVATQDSLNLVEDIRTAPPGQDRLNASLKLWGILPNQYEPRAGSHQDALGLLYKLYGEKGTYIYPLPSHKTTQYNEASARHIDIRDTEPHKSGVALGEYWDVIARDIIARSIAIVGEKKP
jgi:chromosome partitioning protein